MHHVGYWVPDLEKAAERAAATLGVGPFLVHRHVRFEEFRLADGTLITDPAYLDHSAAFAAWGPVVLELARYTRSTRIWRRRTGSASTAPATSPG
jgi:hypothetical protein